MSSSTKLANRDATRRTTTAFNVEHTFVECVVLLTIDWWPASTR